MFLRKRNYIDKNSIKLIFAKNSIAMFLKRFKAELTLLLLTIITLIVGSRHTQQPETVQIEEHKHQETKITITQQQIAQIDSVINIISKNGNFSGSILIGQKDSILYSRSCGYSNIKAKRLNTDTTAFQLASVSKQFTAIAILQLYEQGKLKLTDKATDYLPNFPYADITIHQMLVHRSGLPNYHYLLDRKPMLNDAYFSNQKIVGDLIEANEGRYFLPNRRFQYSNTGYAVLASIVEIVSGLKFEKYLERNIFKPLNMHNTFAYRAMKSVEYPPHATGYVRGRTPASDNYLDHYLGDKGIYSSIIDLFKWDQGLYKGTIINIDTLQLAFHAMGKRPKARSNYGYGWRITTFGDRELPILFHSGWWHGFKTSLVRIPQDTATIVILRNNNRNGAGINQILDILYPSEANESYDVEDDANGQAENESTLLDSIQTKLDTI